MALRLVNQIERIGQIAHGRLAMRGEAAIALGDPGQHFKIAAELVGHGDPELRAGYLNRYAGALQQYGNYRGDNAVLAQAIAVYRAALAEISRDELPLTWAMTQNNLGAALGRLGERRNERGKRENKIQKSDRMENSSEGNQRCSDLAL